MQINGNKPEAQLKLRSQHCQGMPIWRCQTLHLRGDGEGVSSLTNFKEQAFEIIFVPFSQNFANVSMFSQVFLSFGTCGDLFRCVQIRLDTSGCVWMHAFRQAWNFSQKYWYLQCGWVSVRLRQPSLKLITLLSGLPKCQQKFQVYNGEREIAQNLKSNKSFWWFLAHFQEAQWPS